MKPKNIELINRSFAVQAANFESKKMNFSKEEYLQYTVSRVAPAREDTVLETAAGTCACGRSLAPLVHSVVCLDATKAMLEIGKKAAEEAELHNMHFIQGYAEELPFLDASYDIVLSRLSFHHFTDVETAFAEMVRVLKPNGKLVLIDMGATDEQLRPVQDELETLRDPSHVKNLSTAEMQALFAKHGLKLLENETTLLPQALDSWMELTATPSDIQEHIRHRFQLDLDGGEKTGFYPYLKEGKLYFNQRWVLMIGCKAE